MPEPERRVVDRKRLTTELRDKIQTRLTELDNDLAVIGAIDVSKETEAIIQRVIKQLQKELDRLEKQLIDDTPE